MPTACQISSGTYVKIGTIKASDFFYPFIYLFILSYTLAHILGTVWALSGQMAKKHFLSLDDHTQIPAWDKDQTAHCENCHVQAPLNLGWASSRHVA